MIGRDHQITSGALVASTMLLANFPVAPTIMSVPVVVGCSVVGALLPDVDHKNSLISKVSLIPFYKVFKHRGVTHSVLGWCLFTGLLFAIIQGIFRYPNWPAMQQAPGFWVLSGLSLGYLLHLFEDSGSQAGIRWLAPLSAYDQYSYQHYQTLLRVPARWKKTKSRNIPIRHWWGRGYVVGGVAEKVLVGLSIAWLIFAIVMFGLKSGI